jgi:hypothetical protein
MAAVKSTCFTAATNMIPGTALHKFHLIRLPLFAPVLRYRQSV